MDVKGKVVVVTGAGSGIGRATAKLLLASGARVVAADYKPDGLEELGSSPELGTVQGDVSVRADAERMVTAAVERFGRIDALCNVAGIMDAFVPVGDLTDAQWTRVLAVNLTGPMLTCRAAIPLMLGSGGGAIVNVASVGGFLGSRGGAAYTTSKHGLIGLTRNIAATYGRDGIRAVAVCPGAVDTGIPLGGDPSPRGYKAIETTLGANPRMAKPDEIAAVIRFLLSDDASFVNGAAVVADGGWTAA